MKFVVVHPIVEDGHYIPKAEGKIALNVDSIIKFEKNIKRELNESIINQAPSNIPTERYSDYSTLIYLINGEKIEVIESFDYLYKSLHL